jgi:hypothetical protein
MQKNRAHHQQRPRSRHTRDEYLLIYINKIGGEELSVASHDVVSQLLPRLFSMDQATPAPRELAYISPAHSRHLHIYIFSVFQSLNFSMYVRSDGVDPHLKITLRYKWAYVKILNLTTVLKKVSLRLVAKRYTHGTATVTWGLASAAHLLPTSYLGPFQLPLLGRKVLPVPWSPLTPR